VLRGYAETHYRPSPGRSPDLRAWIEATTPGLDIRFVVTSFATARAEHIYDTLYCARGQAKNLIKMHKGQPASDRTSCRSPLANQMRLILHTAASRLMLTMRDVIPAAHTLAKAEFATLRLRLLTLGPRIIETASRVRLALAAACPDAAFIPTTIIPAAP
jgi:Transposase DDE domain group 1